MTRCLFWNVEHFNGTRFYNASTDNDPTAGIAWSQSSADRSASLYRVLEASQPDIIVIVETSTQFIKGSQIVQLNPAPLLLLNWLRGNAATVCSPEWRLVPPLILAGRPNNKGLEAISVFYRGASGGLSRYFTGPNVWPGGVNGPSALPGAAAPMAYGTNTRRGQNVDLNALLVPPLTVPRAIPAGAQHNANLAENTVAARTKLRQVALGGGPGADVDFGEARPPFMVSFTEVDNGNIRDLTLFGVHAPANAPGAAAYILDLSHAFEVISPLGATETRLVGGDFNANLLQANGTPTTTFDPLTVANAYTQLLHPTAPPPVPAGELEAWLGYFGTHINPLDDLPLVTNQQASRFLWSDGNTASYYPSYRYQSALYYSIDNVLVWPLRVPHNYQTTIMNTVLSSPLNSVAPVPPGASAGSVPIASEIAAVPPAAWPQAPLADDYSAPDANQLLAWPRYGHVVSTSDHFALFTDV